MKLKHAAIIATIAIAAQAQAAPPVETMGGATLAAAMAYYAAQPHDTVYVAAIHTGPIAPATFASAITPKLLRYDPRALVSVRPGVVRLIYSDGGQGLARGDVGCTEFASDTGVPMSVHFCIDAYPIGSAK